MTPPPDDRPTPEALLSEAKGESRGGLKIFLGASPGVGKTFKMLQAAQESRRNGIDVVIGIVESHGRQETEALCEGLERIPLQPVEYRGAQFREMDLDAILRRRPEVVLVDELAHRNIPGTRHARRYQDIEEILEHDIDVWTTVNIQHIESLNDVVARITSVRMRETVPDALLEQARDVVLVDLTPRELIERLKQGKVYVPEQARAALDSFFNPSNLAALRELAFQTVADRIDVDMREAMRRRGVSGPWPVKARVVVSIDGSPNSEELVRLGRRIAERRKAPWTVVHVDAADSETARMTAVEKAFRLAERLGGETVMLRGQDVVAEVLAYARRSNATTLIFGRHESRWLAGLIGRTPSQRLLREGGEFEITFVPAYSEKRQRRFAAPKIDQPLSDYLFAIAVVGVCVIGAAFLDPWLQTANLSLVFLVGVLWVAVRTSVRPAALAALLSAVAYNFFFTEPRFNFFVKRTDELATVLFFLGIALIGGRLAARMRRQITALTSAQQQAQALLEFSRRLGAAPDLMTVRREITLAISDYLHVPVVLLARGAGSTLEQVMASKDTIRLEAKELAAAQWAFEQRQSSGYGTDTLAGIDWLFMPMVFEQDAFGVVAIGLGMRLTELGPLTREQLSTIDALVNSATLAIARVTLAVNLEQAKIAEETARLRSALLSSVSHDLRTPLSSMIGSATSLRSLYSDLSRQDQEELLDAIISEGHRLNRYIENLLDMTRLGYGPLKLSREWIDVDDIIESALRRARGLHHDVRIEKSVQEGLSPLYVHPALIEQALFNIVENATKFSPAGGLIRVAAQRDGDGMVLRVTDEGPGIPSDQREKIFDMFTSGGDGDRSKYGSGLGLAICRSMIAAHGGRVEALEGDNGIGTTIAIHLPFTEQADSDAQPVHD